MDEKELQKPAENNLKNLFGPSILQNSQSLQPFDTQNLKPDSLKLVYFSAYWSVPCRAFTHLLEKFYKEINQTSKMVDVLFVSLDHNKTIFEGYFKTMDWMALPYESQDEKSSLLKMFQISGVPSLCLITSSGKLVSNKCREDLNNNKNNFMNCIEVWKSKSE